MSVFIVFEYSTFLIFVILFLILWMRQRSIDSLPPGPTPLPIVGNLFSYGKEPWKNLIKWSQEYSDVMTLYQGPFRKVIWINNVKIGVELFQKQPEIFSQRNHIPFLVYSTDPNVSYTKGSIVWENGPEWKTRRRWMMSALRHFGMGKRSLEIQINTEAGEFCQEATKYESKPFNPQHIINCAVANIICSITFGKRYDYLDPEFVELLKNLLAYFRQCNIRNIEMHIPSIMKLPMFKYKTQPATYIVNFIRQQIKQHVDTFNPENIRDVIDKLLAEGETSDEEEKMFFDPDAMYMSIMTIFLAGAETTSSTLMWFFLYMVTNEDAQEKCHEEIDRVLGSRTPTMADRTRLPYVEATICEVQRLGNIAGTTLPHGNAEECTIRGYRIPKGTTINLNLYRIHTDPNYWDNPLVFNPTRFLSDDGLKVIKPESFMPFGIGRRACLGESMAKMELFLFTTNFLQKFKLVLPKGHQQPDFHPSISLTLCPKPFDVCAIPRHQCAG